MFRINGIWGSLLKVVQSFNREIRAGVSGESDVREYSYVNLGLR